MGTHNMLEATTPRAPRSSDSVVGGWIMPSPSKFVGVTPSFMNVTGSVGTPALSTVQLNHAAAIAVPFTSNALAYSRVCSMDSAAPNGSSENGQAVHTGVHAGATPSGTTRSR